MTNNFNAPIFDIFGFSVLLASYCGLHEGKIQSKRCFGVKFRFWPAKRRDTIHLTYGNGAQVDHEPLCAV